MRYTMQLIPNQAVPYISHNHKNGDLGSNLSKPSSMEKEVHTCNRPGWNMKQIDCLNTNTKTQWRASECEDNCNMGFCSEKGKKCKVLTWIGEEDNWNSFDMVHILHCSQ